MFSRSDEIMKLIFLFSIAIGALIIQKSNIFYIFIVFPVVVMLTDREVLQAVRENWMVTLLLPVCLLLFHVVFPSIPGLLRQGEFNDLEAAAFVPSLRVFVVVSLSIAFLHSSDTRRLASGLTRLGVPVKWSLAVYLGLRYVEVLKVVAQEINESMRVRFAGGGALGWWMKLRQFPRFMFLLVFNSLVRADQAALALESRGFASQSRRTFVIEHSYSVVGLTLVVGLFVWCGFVAWLA